MTTHKSISKDDNIFASIVAQGKTIKSIYAHNFTSINEIINMMTTDCDSHCGLVQLNIRNQSQGWAFNMLFRISDTLSRTLRRRSQSQQPHDGLQYRLAF